MQIIETEAFATAESKRITDIVWDCIMCAYADICETVWGY